MYDVLVQIVRDEFSDIVVGHTIVGRRSAAALKLRLLVRDGTFVDIWLSMDARRYSYHWEQRAMRGIIHCHDNAPDHPEIATFPKHFHDGSEEAIKSSLISSDPRLAIREFLAFVRARLAEHSSSE